jgi:hypothetical protein
MPERKAIAQNPKNDPKKRKTLYMLSHYIENTHPKHP